MYCIIKSRSNNLSCFPIQYHAGLQNDPNDHLKDLTNNQMLRYASCSHYTTYTSFWSDFFSESYMTCRLDQYNWWIYSLSIVHGKRSQLLSKSSWSSTEIAVLSHTFVRMENSPIEAFQNQVGGHTFELQNQGMLHQGSCILKQLQDQGRGYLWIE